MCVAQLSVAMQPCSHRWYTLVRPCSDSTNLANCPNKVRLQGWETRVDECPWCNTTPASNDLDIATHRLFGGTDFSEARRRSDSTVASQESFVRSRSNSISTLSVMTSRSDSLDSDDEAREEERAEQNRLMNRKIDMYMTTSLPGATILKSAAKKQPAFAPVQEVPTSDSLKPDEGSARRSSKLLGRWVSTSKRNKR